MRRGDRPQPLGEAGRGRDDAHVAGRCLGDDRSDLAATGGEELLDRGEVVVGQHDRLAGRGRRDTGGVGQREGRDAGAGLGQQRVDVAVVAAGELHDDRASGRPARQAKGGHRRLGAGGDEADLLDRLDASDDLLGEGHLVFARGAEGEAVCRGGPDGLEHLGVGVTEDHRPPRADEVDVAVAVDVGEPGALGAGDEARDAAHTTEGPHRRVDPTGDHLASAVEEGLRSGGGERHGPSLPNRLPRSRRGRTTPRPPCAFP